MLFFNKRRLIFSSTGHLLFLPIFPVLMSLTCLLFFRWWHSSLVKIHADIRGKNRKKISVSVLSKCDPIWFHYYVVVHDFLQQKVRLSGSSLTSKNFSTEHLLFLPKFPVLNILSLINVSLIKKKRVFLNLQQVEAQNIFSPIPVESLMSPRTPPPWKYP